jgi:dTDP-3-amino-3,4,6-trideoxy-alpha-D-glucose transaminase
VAFHIGQLAFDNAEDDMTILPNNLVPSDRQALTAAWERVTASGRFILGDEVVAFEKEWGEYCGGYCVAVGSGFDALQLCMRALCIGRGDRVLVPSNTCMPTWAAVIAVGAEPVPVEPDPATRCMDITQLGRQLQKYAGTVKAVIPVHLYGIPANIGGVNTMIARYGPNVTVIKDACQAHGMRPGCGGLLNCFSFYPTKNLGALGDAGAIVTNDANVAEGFRRIRNYSCARAINSRMDELQAAILRERLPMLDTWNATRREFADMYMTGLRDLPDLVLPYVAPCDDPCWHQFVIQHPRRDALRAFLKDRQIETLIHYPVPPHRALGLDYNLPIADHLAATVLSLPIAPHLTARDILRVIANVREFCECE